MSASQRLLSSKKQVRFVLFGWARSVKRHIAWSSVCLHQTIADEVVFHFLPADIGKHLPINFDAGRERLATLLLHFPSKGRVLDDVFLLVRKFVLCQDCPDTCAPAAMSFQISDNLRFIHNVMSDDYPISDCCKQLPAKLLPSIARSIFFFRRLERLFQTNHVFTRSQAVKCLSLAPKFFVGIMGGLNR
jgi:hypothetical protein